MAARTSRRRVNRQPQNTTTVSALPRRGESSTFSARPSGAAVKPEMRPELENCLEVLMSNRKALAGALERLDQFAEYLQTALDANVAAAQRIQLELTGQDDGH